MSTLNWDYVLKFVIIGDATTGKSSLLVRLTDQRFLSKPDPTLGVDFGSKLIVIPEENVTVKLQCWDTAGTESFRSLTRSYYRGAAGVLLVYDVTSRPSFEHTRAWLSDVREHADPRFSCILVANKVDLCPDEGQEETDTPPTSVESGRKQREVSREEAERFAQEEGLLFMEASAKTGGNVDRVFEEAARDILYKFRQGVFDDNKSPGVKSTRIIPKLSGAGSVTITHEMPIAEILRHLGEHGCKDVTDQLNPSNPTEYPVSTGGFGDVYRGTLRDGDLVSLKCLRLHIGSTDVAEKQLKHTARELYVWSKCDHPNILALVGVAKYRDQIAMVSPWMENGNLRLLLSRQPQIDRCTLCVQIADGVAYLHSVGIVHGDIKGDNILFSRDFTPKLVDFGNAALREYTLQFTKTKSRAGTSLNWVAPEVLEEKTGFTTASDVYSLGMTILEVITGSIPYAGVQELAVLRRIANQIHPTRPEEHIPSQSEQADLLWSLLKSCWAYSPKNRPTAIKARDKMKGITPEGLLRTSTRSSGFLWGWL